MTRENKGKYRTSGESAGRIKVQEKEMRKKRALAVVYAVERSVIYL